MVSLLELVYRVGGAHLFPLTANPHAPPLPFYRDAIYGFPIDVLALYSLLLAIMVWAGRQLWGVGCAVWNGDTKKW